MSLLLHTGGTIGMRPSPDGLAPANGILESAVNGRAHVKALTPLIDSADIVPAHWNIMLDHIEAENGPVIITHGTDTMAYTGAALTHALNGWPYPVILAGSMHPLGTGGDAERNLDLALSAAPPPGVWLAFTGKILPAGGLVKNQSHADNAFRAIPQIPSTELWAPRRFGAARVAVLTISPLIPIEMLISTLKQLDGAVLRVYGAGTIPADIALCSALADAVQSGKRLRAVSACENGGLIPGSYAAGAGLWHAGVENGGIETAEAALTRLMLEI